MTPDLLLLTEAELQIMRDEGARRFHQRQKEAREALEKYHESLPPADSKNLRRRVTRTRTARKRDRGDLIAIKGRKWIYSNDRFPAKNEGKGRKNITTPLTGANN